MKIKKRHYKRTKYLLFLLFAGLLSCENDRMFSVQNCYGGTPEITIEFEDGQSKFAPGVNESIKENQLNFRLAYPETKEILETNQKLEKGLPFKRMIIIRDGDTTILNKGDEILPMMDRDVTGKATYTICI